MPAVVDQKYPLVPEGPLGSFVHPFRLELIRLGFTPHTAQDNAYVLACLSRWMGRAGLTAGELGPAELERFAARRRELGYRRWLSVRSLAKMLAFLREAGAIPAAPPVSVDPVTALLEEFGAYLHRTRRLSARTIALQQLMNRGFLRSLTDDGGLRLDRLGPDLLIEFISVQRGVYAASSMKRLTCALRSFLRFLFATARVETDLSAAVPSVAGWRLGPLPAPAGEDVLPALLASCDRSCGGVGLRDYAVLMLMADLGLRAIEISRLRLEDVHWRTGQITVRGKGGRVERMPLPTQVGAAIADYLERGRRPSGCREVFLRHFGPDAPASRQAIVSVPRRAAERAGIATVGAHRLRHRMACRVLAEGGNLAEIAQLLRHQSHETTAIYAKIDMASLAAPVRPWPGAEAGTR